MKLPDIHKEFRRFSNRLNIAAAVAAGLFLLLLARFVWLQVIQYDRYHTLSENNRIALLPAPPARGTIYDRNGVILADNLPAYTLEITPSKVGNLKRTINRLAGIVRIDSSDRRRFKHLMAESKSFESIPIRNHLSAQEVARFAVNRFRFPGVTTRARLFRNYPLGDTFAHVVGYIGRINDSDLKRLVASGQGANYRGTDHIGKLGIEKRYEQRLHGHTGIEKVEVNAAGRQVRMLSRTPPVAGDNLYLNLDAKLQQVAEKAFGNWRGALVALDPRNGGVLAMVSEPGFDPNLFVDGIDPKSWQDLNDNPGHPLLNRALRGVYPPGSTIKPFMALAGLQLGVRTPEEKIHDLGYYTLPGSHHHYRDWKVGGHGMVDIEKAIRVSCDTYFYGLAHLMGIQRMHDFLSRFGFGEQTGIDLDNELPGLLPSPAWKEKRFGKPWWPGETVIVGIGQGYLLTTPLQLAVATQVITNNGIIYQPQLLHAWSDSATGAIHYVAPRILSLVKLNPAFVRLVNKAMVEVTHPGGTAARAGEGAPYLFAGKTGTTQVVGDKPDKRGVRHLALRDRDHALFISFAPADRPRIVVAVVVENGGHGGVTAAPIARKVIDYWLLGKPPGRPAPAGVVPPDDQAVVPAEPGPANANSGRPRHDH